MAIKRVLDYLILSAFLVCCECFFFGCPPCEFVECPEPACDEHLRILDPECGCCSVCAKEDGERCGGLTNDQCKPGSTCMYRLGLIIGENRTGICEPAECKRMHCDFRRYCTWYYASGKDPRLICKCPWFECTEKYQPLCAYDGNTYNSICHLQITECVHAHQFIGLKHFGPCAPPPELPTPKSHYLQTNTIPMYEDDLFNQLGQANSELATPAPPSVCTYNEKSYLQNSTTKLDACTFLQCDLLLNVTLIIIPGCPGGPIEPDYGISLLPIHGGWTKWEESECIGTCHGANRTRHRTCTNPTPRYEGRNCTGPASEVLKCIPEYCNYTCEYAEWSDWSPCSVTCGMGMQTRSRGLLNNITKEESNNCDLMETQSCTPTEQECPTYCRVVISGWKTYVNDIGCPTTIERPIFTCDGPCPGGGEECCKVAKKRRFFWAVQCPGEDFWQEGRFRVPKECTCTNEKCPRP